jgi:signal transduction histidine kinase
MMENTQTSKGRLPSLEDFVNRLAQTAPFKVHLETDPVPRLSAQARSAILGVIEEAVANAKAHAQADNLWIELRCQEDVLQVSVRDDGQGFDPEAVQAKYEAQDIDPASDMRSRLAAIQGKLTLRSAVDEGTTLCVVAPLAVNVS